MNWVGDNTGRRRPTHVVAERGKVETLAVCDEVLSTAETIFVERPAPAQQCKRCRSWLRAKFRRRATT